jgi:hypothetical protein
VHETVARRELSTTTLVYEFGMKKLVLLALLVACGGSSAQVKTAREARYNAPEATLLNEVKAVVVAKNYQIALEDPGNLLLETRKIWHTPEGLVDTAPGDNAARLNEGSINLSFVVSIPKVEGAYQVKVVPVILRKDAISSAPQSLTPENALVPGWVHGRIEALEVAIYERLKSYAATGGTAPAVAPPATEELPPATEPAPPAPEAGSAAGSGSGI